MTNQTSHVASKHRHCTPQTSRVLHGCRWGAAGLTNTWRLSSFEDLGDIAVGVSEETPKNGVYRWPGGLLSISIWKEQWWIWTQPYFAYPTNDISLFACLQGIILVRTPQVLWIINVIMVCPWCIHTLWTLLYSKVPFAPEPLPNAGIGVSHPVVSWVYRLAKEWYTCMQMSGVANNIK